MPESKYRYFVAKPDLSGNELKYLTQAIQEGYVSSTGRFIKEFEEAFAKYIGVKYAVACSSGTNALLLALRALDIGPGDEVIVPEFTMVATAWAVSYTGAQPVFVDCGPDLNIDISKIESVITPKTKAIIPVHIYGRPADMQKINEIARRHNLFVIEDAAEAHGAEIQGKKVGSWGVMGCFSLFGNKIITSGEGGIITTNDAQLAEQLKWLRSMAFDEKHTFLHKKIGYNFRMTNLQGAVALAQLERIDEFLAKRKQIGEWYDEYLAPYVIPRPKGSVIWYYDIVLKNKEEKDKVVAKLENNGIESRVFFKPMSMQPMYFRESYKNMKAYDFSERGIYIPTYTKLTKEDIKIISSVII